MNTSEAQPQAPAAPSTPTIRMIRSLVIVALASGVLIAVANQWTLPTIKANKERFLQQAVFQVIPGVRKVVTYRQEADGTLSPLQGTDEKAIKYYAGYDDQGKLVGLALDAQAQGYQDTVRVIYGYDPEHHAIVGFKVLDSKETPGLGDKIGNDPDFLANFKDLDVSLSADGGDLLHAIEVVKKGAKKERWQIDAITGATISSKTVGRMLNASARARLSIVQKNLDRLKEGK